MLKEGRIYAVSNIINRAAGLLLLPLYTRWLSVAEYGVYALIVSLMEVLSMVCGAGLARALSRLYFDYPENHVNRSNVITTAISMMLSMIALVSVISPVIAEPLAWLLTGETGHRAEVLAALPSIPCGILLEVISSYYVVRKAAKSVLLMAIAKAVSLFGLTLWLLVGLNLGVWGILLAQSIAFGLMTMWLSLVFFRRLGWRFDTELAKALLKFGLPLVPSALADTALGMVTRWIVNYNLGPAALGAIAFAQRIAFVIQAFISSPFAQVFFVRRLESLSGGESQAGLNRILSGFMLILGLAVLWLSILSPEIVTLLAPQGYDTTTTVLPLVTLSISLATINLHVEAGLLYTKRTWVLPVIGGATLLLSAPLIWLGSAYYGLVGATAALVCIGLARLLITYRANRHWGAPEIAVGWAPGFAALLMLSLIAYLWPGLEAVYFQGWQLWLVKISGLIWVSSVLLFSRLAPPEWRRALKHQTR